MVKLNRIYTRTGDDGTTGLGTGERRIKYDLRVEAYGTVDETNAAIGMVRLYTGATEPLVDAMLGRIQNDLFDLGADCARPRPKSLCTMSHCGLSPRKWSGSSRKSTGSTRNWRLCAPLSCPAERRLPPICIWPAQLHGAPNG